MSKHETPMTRWYWGTIGGTLIEEYYLVFRGDGCAGRWVDALMLPERETRIGTPRESIEIGSERAVLVQAKASRLGMYLMGQTLFSAELLRARFPLAGIESIALCTMDDKVLRPLLEAHAGCRVVVVAAGQLSPAEAY